MRSHNDKSDTPCTDKVMQKHLEKAVATVPELKAIKTTATQLNKAITDKNKKLGLHGYFDLLEDAATDYDLKKGRISKNAPRGGGRPTKRGVCQHDIDTGDDYYDCVNHPSAYTANQHDLDALDEDHAEFFDADFAADFDVDTPVYDIHQRLQRPNSSNQPSPRTTRAPCLPGSTWHALASGDQRAWDNVTDSGKATIIKDLLHASPPPSQPPKPSPSGSTPSAGMSHHVRFHDTQLADDFVTFEAFRAGRSQLPRKSIKCSRKPSTLMTPLNQKNHLILHMLMSPNADRTWVRPITR